MCKKQKIKYTKKWYLMREGKNYKDSIALLGFPEILGEKMSRKERKFYNENKEALDNLFEKEVESFAKIFTIHVSGGLNNLNKFSIDELIKLAEKNNIGSE